MKVNVNHVKALIAERGQNVMEFSRETGISYGTLTSLFNKSRSGNLKTIGRIAKGLGVSITEIIIEEWDTFTHHSTTSMLNRSDLEFGRIWKPGK